MRKTVLYTALSLDGFIAGEKDDLTWLFEAAAEYEEMARDYEDFYASMETMIMGNGTYRFVVREGVPDPYPGKETYVFTKQKGLDSEFLVYVNENPVTFTAGLKEKDGGDIWVVGGGTINRQLLEKDLIDELQLTLIPVVLGKGTHIFEGLEALKKFSLSDSRVFNNGLVKLTYTLKK